MRFRSAVKPVCAAVTGLTAGVLFAGPAFADGSWGPSTFSSIVPGFDTRNWSDPNYDSVKTALTIKSCYQDSGNRFNSLRWQLRRNHTARPDDNLGDHNFGCATTAGATVAWADMSAGTYHFKYVSADGDTSYYYSANYIRGDY